MRTGYLTRVQEFLKQLGMIRDWESRLALGMQYGIHDERGPSKKLRSG